MGSPAENLTLREIPGTHEFIFQRLNSGPAKGDLAIVNVHPRQGEAPNFLGSPSNGTLDEDYAVVALMRGLDPTESVIILARYHHLGHTSRRRIRLPAKLAGKATSATQII